jgi:hypothetical protein
MMMRYGVNTPKTAGNTNKWKKKICMCNSDGARAHFERSRTRQHRTRKEGYHQEFRKTILDYTKRNMCTKSPYYAWMYKDARTKNPILAKFLHETHYEENDDEGEWYMTDDNWRYFKEFAEIMSDIEAARRR